MEGEWIVKDRENYNILFKAYQGQAYRFTTLRKPRLWMSAGDGKQLLGLKANRLPGGW